MTNYKYFQYFQPNPDKTKNKGDCTIRALCAATNKDWVTVFDSLVYMARKQYDMPNSMDVVIGFLEAEGFVKQTISVKKGQHRPTMQTLIKKHPKTILFGRCAHHVNCAKGGKVLDLWDTSEMPLYAYWIKPEEG